MRLWDSGGTAVDAATLAFTVGDDPELDREILPFDCLASAAHARMLASVGLLAADEREILLAALREAYAAARSGSFIIRKEQEDAHTALEAFLTVRCGEPGRRIHTGRSRNDQVIAALRLLVRERLVELASGVVGLSESLLDLAAAHRTTLMPGTTHTRQAMPSTAGQLFAAVAEGLTCDLDALGPALLAASRGALGSASGYGVPLPIDRLATAALLGLDGVDVNTLHVQNGRGRLEGATLFGLHQLSLTLGRFAADLIWGSSEAYGYFALPEALTTGSSIMPQKRNPDVLELVRALPASMLSRYVEVGATLHGLPAGYHRDLQRTKGPLLRGLTEANAAVRVMALLAAKLEVDVERCRVALAPEIFATDRALALVRDGVPFRDAYQQVKKEGAGDVLAAEAIFAARTHLGAPGTDQVALLMEGLRQRQRWLAPFAQGAAAARALLETPAEALATKAPGADADDS